jgi:hypothetical protein
MFNQLSNQKVLSQYFQSISTAEKKLVSELMHQVIDSLSLPAKELLANRREHGTLIPIKNRRLNESQSIETILSSDNELYSFINGLCLTEAILVRDNFVNVLEEVTIFQYQKVYSNASVDEEISTEPQNELPKNNVEVKNNVSPIKLTKIKHRLSDAIKNSNDQKESIRCNINSLLKNIDIQEPRKLFINS